MTKPNEPSLLDKIAGKAVKALSVESDTDDVVALLQALNKNIQLLVDLNQPSWSTPQEVIPFTVVEFVSTGTLQTIIPKKLNYKIHLDNIFICGDELLGPSEMTIRTAAAGPSGPDNRLFFIMIENGMWSHNFTFDKDYYLDELGEVIVENYNNQSGCYISVIGSYVSKFNKVGRILS